VILRDPREVSRKLEGSWKVVGTPTNVFYHTRMIVGDVSRKFEPLDNCVIGKLKK